MARKPVRRHKIVVDPSFFIPEGAEGVYLDDTVVFEEDNFEDIEEDSTVEEGGLDFPKDIKVLSQKLIRAPGGQQSVEVVFEFSPVTGASDYEIKIALDET